MFNDTPAHKKTNQLLAVKQMVMGRQGWEHNVGYITKLCTLADPRGRWGGVCRAGVWE